MNIKFPAGDILHNRRINGCANKQLWKGRKHSLAFRNCGQVADKNKNV